MTLNLPAGIEIEKRRLQALQRYDVLDTHSEEAFDRITRLASTALDVPIALVSLVDENRQWFKSRRGLDTCETPRGESFCTHTIAGEGPLVVPDALADPRFCDIPLVTGDKSIRSYFGVPLRTHDGLNIGALCVMDTKARQLTADQLQVLRDLAALVVDELELRIVATTDSLTGAMSRHAFLEQATKDFVFARRQRTPVSCVVVDVDHFKTINDRFGHFAGDRVLRAVVEAMQADLRPSDYLGRLGGEEFAVMLPGCDIEGALEVGERLRQHVMDAAHAFEGTELKVTVSVGVAELLPADKRVDDLLVRADSALYAAKLGGRNRAVCHPGFEPVLRAS